MKCINILITAHLNKLIGIEKNDVEIVDPTIPLLEWVVNNSLKVCGAHRCVGSTYCEGAATTFGNYRIL